MSQRLKKSWVKYPLILSALLFAQPALADEQAQTADLLDQISAYSNAESSMQQVSGASQFSDVSPRDWAFQALDDLSQRYGCLRGYPNGTFRGNRALTRYEFAAGLNACLNQIERLIAGAGTGLPTDDSDAIRRLTSEFQAELNALGARVDGLEDRVAFLEDNSFSTTTKLVGEVAMTLADSWGNSTNGGNDDPTETVFHDKVRLQFVTSFTGKDRLFTRLTAGNLGPSFSGELGTFEGRYAFDGNADNNVTIDRLHYYFPLNKKTRAYVMANLGGHHFYADTFNQGLEAGGGANGALSRFAERNPIYRQGLGGQGAAIRTKLADSIELSAGYLARGGNSASSGVVAGNYSAMGQLAIAPSNNLKFGLTYIHSYDKSGTGLFLGGTGTNLGRLNALNAGENNNFGVSSNSYGIQGKFDLSDSLSVRAWGGYTAARLIGEGDAQVWNYALALVFPDLGKQGNMGYIIGGAEPYRGDTANNDIPWHIEAAYKYKIGKNISLTPGLTWLLNPNQTDSNEDILIGTLRTTFSF